VLDQHCRLPAILGHECMRKPIHEAPLHKIYSIKAQFTRSRLHHDTGQCTAIALALSVDQTVECGCCPTMLTHVRTIDLPSDTATCHAWNLDNSFLAVSHGTPEVFIYTVTIGCGAGRDVECIAKLSEHNQVVSSMEWSKSGLLLTCSHDRTSYVWCKVRKSTPRS
jgi:WD40 repeat protein